MRLERSKYDVLPPVSWLQQKEANAVNTINHPSGGGGEVIAQFPCRLLPTSSFPPVLLLPIRPTSPKGRGVGMQTTTSPPQSGPRITISSPHTPPSPDHRPRWSTGWCPARVPGPPPAEPVRASDTPRRSSAPSIHWEGGCLPKEWGERGGHFPLVWARH